MYSLKCDKGIPSMNAPYKHNITQTPSFIKAIESTSYKTSKALREIFNELSVLVKGKVKFKLPF